MAASGLEDRDVGRCTAVLVAAVGIALCGLLLGVPGAAAGTTPAGIGVRSAVGTAPQISPVPREAEMGAAVRSEVPPLTPVALSAATLARATTLRAPGEVFVGRAPHRSHRVRRVDVDHVRGRGPPGRRAAAAH